MAKMKSPEESARMLIAIAVRIAKEANSRFALMKLQDDARQQMSDTEFKQGLEFAEGKKWIAGDPRYIYLTDEGFREAPDTAP